MLKSIRHYVLLTPHTQIWLSGHWQEQSTDVSYQILHWDGHGLQWQQHRYAHVSLL